ncbi:hypothetical protein GCM10010492_63560 [Saccharothrix mutabilis subsp. mutabilis]|uniref:Uncharacterized protein n=1 Tax=Saccharothrix mutabilis subsp. mutabilis TaxID=66855 RepID=A0ABP3E6M8_9PSEU
MRQTARRLLGAAALLVAVTSATAGTALASPGDIDPDTRISDPRATVYVGNLEINDKENVCEVAGLAGTPFDEEDGVKYELDGSTKINILGFEGYTITGVVVKGSNVANIYDASKVDPLTGLISPLNPGGNVPDISHWFLCAVEDEGEEPTSETSTPTNPGGENPGGETPTSVPTEAPATSVTTTTPAAAAAGANDNDQLAATGFGSGWLLVVGLALVGAGAAFVASPKLRGLVKR